MRLRVLIIGTVGGLFIGGVLGAWLSAVNRSALRAAPLREDCGEIARVVMHYHPAAGRMVIPIYTQFLAALSRDVHVVWVVGTPSAADDLRKRLGQACPMERSRILVVGKDISTWSKDRFVALRVSGAHSPTVLCAPVRSRTANPLRTNDQEAPYRLAQTFPHLFQARKTEVDFDGGDFLATARHLFAGPAIVEKNRPGDGARFHSAAELTEYLSRRMSRNIIWLGGDARHAPPHHLGMFLTVIGNTAAVGDVRMAEQVAAAHPETYKAFQVAGGIAPAAFRRDLARRLDRVARQMRGLGYHVIRVPLLPAAVPKAWMSYNNGIVETRQGHPIFYMPTFGAKALDTAAAESFCSTVGCKVIPIDCSTIWPLGGSLHCLVNVVERTE